MQLTLIHGEKVFSLQVDVDLELSNLIALVSMEVGKPPGALSVMHNGRKLPDSLEGLNTFGISDNDLLTVEDVPSQPASLSRIPGQSNLDQDSQDPIAELRSRPQLLDYFRHARPDLWQAITSKDDARARQLLEKDRTSFPQYSVADVTRLAMADPMDVEAQRHIEQLIRRQNVARNFEMAMEEIPEAFVSVSMLFVDCKVNGHTLKAFIDTGAQSTLMSKVCAERCGVLQLLDESFKSFAVGIGVQATLGRVHICPLQIGQVFLPCSFVILQEQPIDIILGLDMLRRHRCTIDLDANKLRIASTGTEASFVEGTFLRN